MCFIQLQDNEGKENGIETDERKDDSIVYADLDKSAMSEGTEISFEPTLSKCLNFSYGWLILIAFAGSSVAVENEKTTYAEIKPGTKE